MSTKSKTWGTFFRYICDMHLTRSCCEIWEKRHKSLWLNFKATSDKSELNKQRKKSHSQISQENIQEDLKQGRNFSLLLIRRKLDRNIRRGGGVWGKGFYPPTSPFIYFVFSFFSYRYRWWEEEKGYTNQFQVLTVDQLEDLVQFWDQGFESEWAWVLMKSGHIWH